MNKRGCFTLVAMLLLMPALTGTLTVTAAPLAAPGAWWGDYFSNAALGGAPAMSRYDDTINFNWGVNGPGGSLPADNFSVRWVRDDWFEGGTYRFTVVSDDGVRLWVGDQLVLDAWRDQQAATITVDRYVAAGIYHVKVEYYEHSGGAMISVGWSRVVGGAAWRGEYFANRDLSGVPVLTRDDGAIDFDWYTGSPDPAIPADDFSVRWTRALYFNAGTYRFLTSTDDGVRVRVDGTTVVDAWTDQQIATTHTGDISLSAGQHTITVEYYEHGGDARAHVWWQLLGTYSGWHGEYFDNPNLVGGPALERDDAEINFDWGQQPPVDWMPDDNFSVRWTRTVNFTPGYYRFVTQADDGVRVWIDQGLLIDQWHDMPYELHYVDGTYLTGKHTIRVEYYEHTGGARIRAYWEPGTNDNNPPGVTGSATPIPTPTSTPAATVPNGPWNAAYFANANLSGDPALTRTDSNLDFNWGTGSPDASVPKDNFSARWTQTVNFSAGTYRFTTYTDDGVRLWVDGRLVISSWWPMRGYRYATVQLTEGAHEIKMEYYERTGAALARLTWQFVSR